MKLNDQMWYLKYHNSQKINMVKHNTFSVAHMAGLASSILLIYPEDGFTEDHTDDFWSLRI
jgi:hypothetical protein